MAKNRTYHRRYVIEVKGITTNNFMAGVLDKTFDGIVEFIQKRYAQTRVTKYTTEDIRTGGRTELTPGGIQVNLMYQSIGNRFEK